jgi:hypothetical protein
VILWLCGFFVTGEEEDVLRVFWFNGFIFGQLYGELSLFLKDFEESVNESGDLLSDDESENSLLETFSVVRKRFSDTYIWSIQKKKYTINTFPNLFSYAFLVKYFFCLMSQKMVECL